MKVKEICTHAVKSCTRDSNLAEVGALMWDGDCGLLPVLDETGKVVGVITDRDVCMSAATNHRPAAQIAVREVIGTRVLTCRLNDEIRQALKTIRTEKVRRLPVVDGDGLLQGMLSLNDLALASKPERDATPTDVTYEDLALAMKAICGRRVADKASATAWVGASLRGS
jgi:CBS domain-containing protein